MPRGRKPLRPDRTVYDTPAECLAADETLGKAYVVQFPSGVEKCVRSASTSAAAYYAILRAGGSVRRLDEHGPSVSEAVDKIRQLSPEERQRIAEELGLIERKPTKKR